MKNLLNYIYSIVLLFICTSAFPQETNTVNMGALNDSVIIDLGFGFGRTKEKTTASVEMITQEELKQTSAISLQEALYGRLPGLTALNSGGFVGDSDYGASFNIRGIQSMTENHVLILVDGLERPINRLSVDEVESVSVLKDAAAIALYGYRGINGAILVKTKRGTNGRQIHASYDHKFTFKPSMTKMADSYTYAMALNEARSNDGLSPYYNSYELDAFRNGQYPTVYPNVNWADETLRNVGSENIVNLSISGGNDKLKYFTLLNYTDSRGLLNGTDVNDGYSTQLKYSKANIRTNLDIVVTSTTKLEVNVMGTFFETSRPSQLSSSDQLYYYLYALPSAAFPVKTSDGIWGGNTVFTGSNPVARIQSTGYLKSHARSFYTDAKLTQDLGFWVEGLSASARLGYDNYSDTYEDRYKGFEYANDRYVFSETGEILSTTRYQAGNRDNSLSFDKELADQWRRANFNFSVDYWKNWYRHSFSGSLIFTNEATVLNGRHNKFFRKNLSGWFHYDYADKYLADLALVFSGSNRSYPEKFAFSPTMSLGWIASKEDFLKESPALTLLKLRGSAGILHSDYIPFAGIDREDYNAGAGSYYFGDGYNQVWGFAQGYLPTRSFKLETAYKYNIGVDLSIFNSFFFTVEGFYQRRSNILMSEDGLNSSVIGKASAYVNKGKLDSKGAEVILNYRKKIDQVVLNTGAFFTYTTNKIIDMVEEPKAYSYLEYKGKAYDQLFGMEAIGFFKDQEEIDNSPSQEFSLVRPGDIKYKDQNGDGVINDNDQVAIGKGGSLVPRINYAFHLGLEYKGIGFNLLFQGVDRYDQVLGFVALNIPIIENTNISMDYYENRWIPGADNTNAKYPRLTSENNPNNFRNNTVWSKNTWFLKLRNCEIYYKVPSSRTQKALMQDVKLYLKGENLLAFDGIKIIDPEVLSFRYPINKAVNIGISMKF